MNEIINFRSLNGCRHGQRYELEDFRRRYELDADQAKALFVRFGPSVIELDLLMTAKRRKANGERLSLD